MLRDVYWRQYPIDLLSDDKMACVEAMLPDDQKHIPYMIYIAALKLCDDNGVFDIDDGVVLARLTRVKDVRTIINIVNLMRQRKILFRLFDNSTLCGLVDWTYSDKKPRTIEDRRRLVTERIQKEQARAGVDNDFTLPGEQTAPKLAASIAAPAAAAPEVQTAPAAPDSLCAENDKSAKNVVISEMDDKNAKNVVTLQDNTVQDNKTDNTDIQTNTHTQQQVPGYGPIEGPPPVPCEGTNAVGVENIQNQNTESAYINTSEDASAGVDVSTLAEMALQEQQESCEENHNSELVAYLDEFFVKNCYGYKSCKSAYSIHKLANAITDLSDNVNPPLEVAGVMCSEFKNMCEGKRGKHWKDMPKLPARMINPNVWAVLVEHAGKILATNKNSDKFIAAAKKAQEECEAEKELVSDAMREEYLKYNIDPDDPDASKKIIIAKAQEQKAAREAAEVETETAGNFEIF